METSPIEQSSSSDISWISPRGSEYLSLTYQTINIASVVTMVQDNSAGAISTFLGTTRNNFEGKEVVSLEYEAYSEMAISELKTLCDKVRAEWEVCKIAIVHKLGNCPVGDCSVAIAISSAHRKESLQAVEFTINELKRTVPIWKKEKYSDHGSSWKRNAEAEIRN